MMTIAEIPGCDWGSGCDSETDRQSCPLPDSLREYKPIQREKRIRDIDSSLYVGFWIMYSRK
jgi:hypothetical protein